MWVLSDNKVIVHPVPITINGIQHPKEIFTSWSKTELAGIGIKPFIEDKFNMAFYTGINSYFEEIDGVVYKRYELQEKYALNELKRMRGAVLIKTLKAYYKSTKEEKDFLLDVDPSNDLITAITVYHAELKAFFNTIAAEIKALVAYDAVIQYSWADGYPISPLNIEV